MFDKMKLITAFCLTFFYLGINCQTIRIGLFTENQVKSINLSSFNGSYLLISDSLVKEVSTKDILDVKIKEGKFMELLLNQKYYSSPTKIALIQLEKKNTILLQPINST